jgi:hypothetical protein
MNRAARFGLVLLVAAAALLVQMPARRAAGLLDSLCAGQCRVANMEGPWWAGHGELFARSPGNGRWLALGPFAWRAAGLFPPAVEFFAGEGHARLSAGTSGLELRLAEIALPAELVLAQPRLNLPAAGWRGLVRLEQTTVRRSHDGNLEAAGTARWMGAATSLLEDYPLGDIELRWSWNPQKGMSGQLSGGRGGHLSIEARLDANGLAGTATLSEAARVRLDKYVGVIARPDPARPGQYVFTAGLTVTGAPKRTYGAP